MLIFPTFGFPIIENIPAFVGHILSFIVFYGRNRKSYLGDYFL
jgi:hypothetical protein